MFQISTRPVQTQSIHNFYDQTSMYWNVLKRSTLSFSSEQCCACHGVVIDTCDLVTFSHDQSHASSHLTSAERENVIDGPPSSGSTNFDGHQ